MKDVVIKYSTDEEKRNAIRGMLNAKKEWLEYVKKREAELSL